MPCNLLTKKLKVYFKLERENITKLLKKNYKTFF